jgi:hypothetical protein
VHDRRPVAVTPNHDDAPETDNHGVRATWAEVLVHIVAGRLAIDALESAQIAVQLPVGVVRV